MRRGGGGAWRERSGRRTVHTLWCRGFDSCSNATGVADVSDKCCRKVTPHQLGPELSIPLTHSGVADFLPSPHTHSPVTTLPPSHLALVTHRAPVSRPARRRLTKTNRTTSWHNWFTPRTFFGKSLVSFLPTLYVIRERFLFCTVHPNNREFVHLNNWKWKWVLRSFVQFLT